MKPVCVYTEIRYCKSGQRNPLNTKKKITDYYLVSKPVFELTKKTRSQIICFQMDIIWREKTILGNHSFLQRQSDISTTNSGLSSTHPYITTDQHISGKFL